MGKTSLGLGLLLWAACVACGAAPAVTGAAADGIERQLRDIRAQLGEMRAEMGKLSGRLDKIEALIPSPTQRAKTTVNIGGAPSLGRRTARIGMVEFSDYQCPYCRRFHLETFPQIQKIYIDTGRLVFTVKNFPLDFHPLALEAAEVVGCARQQNIKAFWDVQGDMYAEQSRLGKAFYAELEKRYGLDDAEFSKCLAQGEQKRAIADDLKYAQSLGVEGTPTFFIGRLEGERLVDAVRIVGAQPYRVFAAALDAYK